MTASREAHFADKIRRTYSLSKSEEQELRELVNKGYGFEEFLQKLTN